jgi:beta-1,2-rhamnosyltransferase WsaF-like protein
VGRPRGNGASATFAVGRLPDVPSIRATVRRSGRLTALARGLREAISGPAPAGKPRAAAELPPGLDGVPELHRVTARNAPAGKSGPRLNLLIPTLNPARLFGGAQTALDLFDVLGASFARLRIVAFQPIQESALEAFEGFRRASPGDERTADRVIVAAPRGGDSELAVGPDDVFLATFWTTAELAGRLVRWQATAYGHEPRPFAYLVQDFEPGFYAWSAQSELARSLYTSDLPTIAVVNSSLLATYLADEGVRFAEQFTFEPRMDRRLREVLGVEPHERTRRLVAYGRPETPRNAFPLVVDGLRTWVRRGGGSGWEIVSIGRPHPAVELGRGLEMRSLGKLEIEAYASLLTESAVGLSLMVSPHPSYPPLDMAHLGMRVVTNRFGPKDLTAWHENIVSAGSLTAGGVADAVAAQVAAFEADPHGGEGAHTLESPYLAEGPIFPFAETLAEHLKAGL